MTETTILDLDTLLDSSLDTVEDIPEFLDPPAGTYLVKVHGAKVTANKDKTKPATIRITYAVEGTKELANKDVLPVPDGSLFSETFQATEQGLGYFKQRAKAIMNVADVNGVPVRDLLAALESGTSFNGAISYRVTKGTDKATREEREYTNLNIRISHDA